MGVGGGRDTEEQDARQTTQDKHIAQEVSLSQIIHTLLRSLKEPATIVNTFLLQMNMSRNKDKEVLALRMTAAYLRAPL